MAERIVIEGDQAMLSGEDGAQHAAPLEAWTRRVNQASLRGLTREPIADLVRWHVTCGIADVVIVELPPALRVLQWIAADSPQPYGPEATVCPRRLATPYVILKASFRRHRLLHRAEVFYRNAPLENCSGPGGELFWPNLLNVSPNAHGCTAWLCTQFLDAEIRPGGITADLNAVVHHLWGGPFNLSSEAHENASTFSKARDEAVDPRVIDVERWEAESVADPRFILGVPWRSTGLDVRKLVLAELACQQIATFPNTASALANLLLRCKTPTKGREQDED